MLRGGRQGGWWSLANGGCSCCNSKSDHRKEKKRLKAKEKRQWRKEADDE